MTETVADTFDEADEARVPVVDRPGHHRSMVHRCPFTSVTTDNSCFAGTSVTAEVTGFYRSMARQQLARQSRSPQQSSVNATVLSIGMEN
jgi:hypothetical protein